MVNQGRMGGSAFRVTGCIIWWMPKEKPNNQLPLSNNWHSKLKIRSKVVLSIKIFVQGYYWH